MIFNINNHIQKIINGTKTQTRRSSRRYQVGKTYSIQPCRICKGISKGRILIIHKGYEHKPFISEQDAKAEGGYTPTQFEQLYEEINPNWLNRWVYIFRFIPKEKAME